jgi:excisionase family DNA binding protein
MGLKDHYYTVAQAAEELNVTRQTIYRWIKNGILKAETIGRETLIEKAEIFRYRDKKVGNWLYQGFNISLERNNYRPIREYLGYTEKDKIKRAGDSTALTYLVLKENGPAEMVTIKSIHVSLNKKTGDFMSDVDPKDIVRKPIKSESNKETKMTDE